MKGIDTTSATPTMLIFSVGTAFYTNDKEFDKIARLKIKKQSVITKYGPNSEEHEPEYPRDEDHARTLCVKR